MISPLRESTSRPHQHHAPEPIPNPPGNIAETLTQGVNMGDRTLERSPTDQTATSNPTNMLTTATQAIDTAFSGTKFSNENSSGGCGGNSTTDLEKKERKNTPITTQA